MIPTLTLAGFPAGNGTHQFDWRGNNTLRGASGVGKSTVVNAMLSLFGAADLPAGKLTIEAVTGGNTTLSVAQTAGGSKTYERRKGDSAYKGAAWRDFSAWTPAAQDPDLVRAIALPLEWHRLATADLGRPLRDLFARVLPPADVPARIRSILEAAGLTVDERLLTVAVVPKDSDYATEVIRQLRIAQTDANSAKDKAEEAARIRAETLAETKANAVDPVDEKTIAAAQAIVNAAEEWAAYDRRVETYNASRAEYDRQQEKRREWQASIDALPARPEADNAALLAAAEAIGVARAAVHVAEAEERAAAERARIETAVAEAAAKAEADTARQVAEAEERGRRMAQESTPTPPPVTPRPVAPAPRPAPKPSPQPAPAPLFMHSPEPARCPTCHQTLPETADVLDF